jgi:alkylhydroperoxidase family enzyme
LPYIRSIPPEEATGALAEEYATAQRRAGYVAHILRLQSLNPAVLHAGVQLYVAIMHGPSALTRAQREMIATVVSSVNDCFY